MSSRCASCGHARSSHGTWWVDRGVTPCHVRACPCTDFDDGCQCPPEVLAHGMHLADCPHPGLHAWSTSKRPFVTRM